MPDAITSWSAAGSQPATGTRVPTMERRANRGSNKNQVPSASQRRALKAWMLATFGDGVTAPCSFCGRELLWSQITRDRFPKPGRRGGRYVKGNVRPACMSCNASEGARQAAIERTEAEARHQARLLRRRELYALKRCTPRSGDEIPGMGSDSLAA